MMMVVPFGLKTCLLCIILCVSLSAAVRVSNVALPLDNRGLPLLTGEAHVMQHSNSYYFYFNNWGGMSTHMHSITTSLGSCKDVVQH